MIGHRLATLFALVSGLGLVFESSAVRATDVGSAEYTKPIDDLTLEIGTRRLHLPPGHWYFTARRVGPTYGGEKESGYAYLGAAALIENGVHLETVAFQSA